MRARVGSRGFRGSSQGFLQGGGPQLLTPSVPLLPSSPSTWESGTLWTTSTSWTPWVSPWRPEREGRGEAGLAWLLPEKSALKLPRNSLQVSRVAWYQEQDVRSVSKSLPSSYFPLQLRDL